MSEEATIDHPNHRQGGGEALVTLHPVALAEVWAMLAPWIGHVLLIAAAIFGLATASGAADDAAYDAGMVTFLVAVVLIAFRVKRQLDGAAVGLLLPIAIEREDGLLVTIAALTVLGLVGGILAASVGGVFYGVGLALFLICAGMIFFEIKHYFDRRAGHS